jgi:hypothetical protein
MLQRWINTVKTYFEKTSRTVVYLSVDFCIIGAGGSEKGRPAAHAQRVRADTAMPSHRELQAGRIFA